MTRRRMDPDRKELLGALFATATAAAEDIADITLRGQSSRQSPGGYARTAARLARATSELRVIAEAIVALAGR